MVHEMTPSGSGLPYRNSAGVCLFNKEGRVLIAERSDQRGAWQLPQGGIQVGEDPDIAVFREMKEEIGTNNARIIGKAPERWRYDFPDYMQYRHGIFHGKYKGQEQVWYAMLFLGRDDDIDLSGGDDPEPAEFISWRWAELADVTGLIVDFKKPVYERIVTCFTPLAEAIKTGVLV